MKKRILYPERFARSLLTDDHGNPLDYQGRPYLLKILQDPQPRTLLLASRQSGKSTLLATMILYWAALQPGIKILFCTAEKTHRDLFHQTRLKPQLAKDRWLGKNYLAHNSRSNRYHLRLSNGSEIFFRNIANNPLSVRGISADVLYIDEAQAIPQKNILTAQETLAARPEGARVFLAGTASYLLNPFTDMWLSSTQNEWLITCGHCKRENDPLRMAHLDQKKPYLFCQHCGGRMTAERGRWVAQNPTGSFAGFRIPRLLEPHATWHNKTRTGILDLFATSPRDFFKQEIMALPSGHMDRAFPWELVVACCEDYHLIQPHQIQNWNTYRTTLGTVDWAYNIESAGQSFTIFAVWELLQHWDCRLLYVQRLEGPQYADWEVGFREMVEAFRKFRVDAIIADRMFGEVYNQKLRSFFPRVREVTFDGSSPVPLFSPKLGRYQMNKTESMDWLRTGLAERKIHFPKLESVEPFLRDFQHVVVKYDPEKDKKKYVKMGGPDDFVTLANMANGISQIFDRIY